MITYKWPSFAVHFKAVVPHCDQKQMTQTKLQRGLQPEKDTGTMGFVKYSPQYVPIILTFVGVRLSVSRASLVSRLHVPSLRCVCVCVCVCVCAFACACVCDPLSRL